MPLLLLWVPSRFLAYFSLLGIACQLALFSFLAITGAAVVEAAPKSPGQDMVASNGLAPTFGVLGCFLSVFNAHSAMPMLYQSMAEPEKWGRVVLTGTGLSCLYYAAVGLCGYYVFGDACAQSFTLNLGRDGSSNPLPGFGFMGPLSGLLISLKMLTTFPALAAPIMTFVEFKARLTEPWKVLAWRALFIAGTCFLAVAGRNLLPYLTALRGALVHSILAVAAPFVIYMKLNLSQIKPITKLVMVAGLTAAYGFTIPGTIADLKTIFGG